MGRFINADTLISTGQGFLGNNMFIYCLNNPVNNVDRLGNEAVRIDLTDQDKDGDGIPDEPGGGSFGENTGPANSGYTAPSGGGGVSNSYQVGNTTVDFGHGGRHIDASQYNVAQIEKAIANDVVSRYPSYDHAASVHGFSYNGLSLYYSYFTRSPIHINVGTYYVERYLD